MGESFTSFEGKSCIRTTEGRSQGESDSESWVELPERRHDGMTARCGRYGENPPYP